MDSTFLFTVSHPNENFVFTLPGVWNTFSAASKKMWTSLDMSSDFASSAFVVARCLGTELFCLLSLCLIVVVYQKREGKTC